MVAGAIAGNISREATRPSGTLLDEAIGGPESFLSWQRFDADHLEVILRDNAIFTLCREGIHDLWDCRPSFQHARQRVDFQTNRWGEALLL